MEFYFFSFFSLFFCVSCVVTIGSERMRFSFLFRPGSERMRVGKFGARLHFDEMGVVVGRGRWRCAIRRQYHTHSVLCPCILPPTTELFSNSHLGTTPAKYGSCSREISCRGWRNITFIMEVVGIIFTRCGNHQFSNMPDPVAGEEGPWTPVPCRVQECRCDCFFCSSSSLVLFQLPKVPTRYSREVSWY